MKVLKYKIFVFINNRTILNVRLITAIIESIFGRYHMVAQLEKNMLAITGDQGSILGSGRPPGEGNGNPLQYFCLGNLPNRRV